MNDEPGRDETGRDKGLDEAWARIVAEYDRSPDDSADHLGADRPGTEAGSTESAESAGSAGSADVGDWVPPVPPPLPRPTGATGAAWVALSGGPLLLLASIIVGWQLPTLLTAGCIIGFIGGLVFLIAQMDDRRHRDGWDDGAQL